MATVLEQEFTVTDKAATEAVLELCREVYAETEDAERQYDAAPPLLQAKLAVLAETRLGQRAYDTVVMRGLMAFFYRECKLHQDKVKDGGQLSSPTVNLGILGARHRKPPSTYHACSIRMLSRRRHALDICRCGDVHKHPGPSLRVLQWNAS